LKVGVPAWMSAAPAICGRAKNNPNAINKTSSADTILSDLVFILFFLSFYCVIKRGTRVPCPMPDSAALWCVFRRAADRSKLPQGIRKLVVSWLCVLSFLIFANEIVA